ncbi:radical SAM protein [Tautonia sociabilis]|uniref:Radical SAM protein n=1 Tax=Tautonia sociabilis TaxID=2080755 RepID=A0A432MKF5_9BACT|nr:radical SAM protein [Tautonia sociabilis]RUL87903.1 radical SAM protein [Tautonia sociabilis]
MTEGATIEALSPAPSASASASAIAILAEPASRGRPRLTRVRRRGPLLRPARGEAGRGGLFGIDLTAGCALDCAFCYVRGTPRYPGPGRLLFDPRVVEAIGPAIDAMEAPPRRVVLSPSSDPLPPVREVRRATLRIVEELLGRGIEVVLMTRGRVTRDVAGLLGSAPGLSRAAVGVATLRRSLSRALEPMAPPGLRRLRGIATLLEAGVPVEVRLEPLIAGLTDARENLLPLLRELGRIGVQDVLAHYAFLQPAFLPTLRAALEPIGHAERLADLYEGGPVFSLGELGATKHLPLASRREGLARILSWGAEAGLLVRTGPGQNPDLPRLGGDPPPAPPAAADRPRPARAGSSSRFGTPAGAGSGTGLPPG